MSAVSPMSPSNVVDDVESGLASAALAEDVTQAESAPQALPPGQQLRAAREARGLQIDDVANVLRFSPRQIELLEADRYDDLPGATLVRGFVRGYAKLLKLDANPLLAALTPDVPPSLPEVRPPVNMGEAEDPGMIDSALGRPLPWGSMAAAAIILLALGLVVYFVQTAGPGGLAFVSAPAIPTATTPPAAPPAVAQPATVALATPVVATPPASEAVMPPVTPLVVEFDAHSWIEVRDAAQKIVFVGEYPKGTRQVIEGQAPFQLWIGKASSVRVTYGERSIDLKPHTREEVARLTVE